MGGRTMPTECVHQRFGDPGVCRTCLGGMGAGTREWVGRIWVEDHPAEAVAQLVADGVLVERECRRCDGDGEPTMATEPMATKYFLDTEFIDDGRTIDLISIGVVSDDGREFYAELDVDWSKASPWVLTNVKPHLVGAPSDRVVVADLLRAFVAAGDGAPEFWSWCAAYDWIAVCQLYGTMFDKPADWPNYCRDLQQELDRFGISDDYLPPHPGAIHSALGDAVWHRDIYDWLHSEAAT